MEMLAYLSAIVMGAVLGLIGGGGSILTLPILVYLFQVPPVLATAYSLFIVGITSVFGLIPYLRSGQVALKTGVFFALPAMFGVFVARKFVMPRVPEQILSWGTFILTKDMALMGLFAIMMVAASFSMMRSSEPESAGVMESLSEFKKTLWVVLEGLIVGLLTGLVGAGGGFLVIPVLVIFARLEMKVAVATSLLVISIKSLVGFLGDVGSQVMDWPFLLGFSFFTIGGALLGAWVSNYVPNDKLKPAFGWFVLIMGVFILVNTAIHG